MKKILMSLVLVAVFISQTLAGFLTIDTQIRNTNVMNRFSRVAYAVTPDMSARLTYNTLNGIGLTGELNNFVIGGQAVSKAILIESMTVEPFVGLGYSRSDLGSALFGDFGVELKYKFLPWLLPVAGFDFQIYSDSYIIDYNGGVNIPLLDFISLDILYSAVLTNDKHLMGAGARINLVF